MKNSAIKQNASALVIALAFLFLITVLTVGFIETVRTEHVSANSHLEGLQGEFYAQAAVERVVATLQMQTAPQQSGSNVVYNWVSQPGQLIVSDSTSNGRPTNVVDLSSGTANTALSADSRTYLRPPNLNIPTFRNSSTYLITEYTDTTGNAIQMSVAWIYVRQDGTLDTNSVPDLTNKTNPIVGRYAYWTDDESSKINFNLAWGRISKNTNSPGDPSRISLTALQPLSDNTDANRVAFTQEWADSLHNYIVAPRFYNSPEDVRVMSGTNQALAKALEYYKSEMTHYNSDPDTTFFNEPRIVLTTQVNKVPITTSGTAPFLDILKTPNADPGDISGISDAKLTTVINMLIQYLKRTDWPMAYGSNFQQKYYNGVENRLAQLAINIIDYVRCKESNLSVVQPLRGDLNNPGQSNQKWVSGSPTDSNAYIGVTRAPCITELAAVSSGSVVKIELYSPPNYHMPDIDLTTYTLYVAVNGLPESPENYIPASELSQTILKPGTYTTITHTYVGAGTITPGYKVGLRIALGPPSMRVDIVPLLTANNINVLVDGPSVEVNDPRINKHYKDWKDCPNGSNTFGAKNARYLNAETGSVSPQQDTDASGNLSDSSLYMPPPKGSSDNEKGVVTSIGELGYIHTGAQSALVAGTPWRTIRLQPNNDPSGTVPDWALMDLFTVPVTGSSDLKAISQPNGTSYGGRVNVNSHVLPFDIQRVLPLAAVFQDCAYDSQTTATLSSGSAQSIAQNIYNRVTATGGKLYNFSNGYYSPGEIVEISGIADKGEQSEELVRQVSNLMTTRGNVFTVNAIGETLKQTLHGSLVVTGQRRLQSMVERYVSDPSTGEVRLRTVYYRNLTP
ncbi:MAG: hypothetical protein ACFUZC_10535 [Chthoniobacteraceae bacterium]